MGNGLEGFWGKAGGSDRWHPAACHMVDVGEVTRAFLERPAATALRRSLASGIGSSEAQLVELVAFLAATHDIGKVSPGFQYKRENLAPRESGLAYRPGVDEPDHGRVTLVALRRFLIARGLTKLLATGIARALGAHHGAFPAPLALGRSPGGAGWESARAAHLDALERHYGPDLSLLAGRESLGAEWLISLAGVTSVCDWIGSSEDLFPWEQGAEHDLAAYAGRSAVRAVEALHRLGFTGWAPTVEPLSFARAFGFAPNAMQGSVVTAAESLSQPGLIVIEAPMGLGKTEAALAAADVLLRRFQLAGVYYALPTQATSNQMFGRLIRFLEQRYAGLQVDLHLLHGLSDLNPDYAGLRLSAISQDPDATVRASSWFAAAKRGLLAPFGVGTIDQALLSVLAVRHVFVRLLGLAQKVVILDEVHAYDTYMSELLDHMVGWLAALGSPVIVLSATLPPARRAALLRAYSGVEQAPVRSSYPQVSVAERGGQARASSFDAGRTARIALSRMDPPAERELDHVAAEMRARLASGGCAAWICNTVGRAQYAYAAAKDAMAGLDCKVALFHARFPTGARLAIEKQVLTDFGKQGPRPHRAILVATQVVEQSLDLDFDFMVTDLAPVDLMLQRAGRLHRHPGRARPTGLASPTLAWLSPSAPGGIPSLGVHGVIYEPFILLRSWAELRARPVVNLPDDVTTLIDAVYGDQPQAVEAGLAAAIEDAKARHQQARREATQKAVGIEIRAPEDLRDLADAHQFLLEEEESPGIHQTLRARTRLTQPSVTIVCAERQGDELRLTDGTPLDFDGPPDRQTVRAARLSSLVIQRWEWFQFFTRQAVPGAWQKAASLRDCRLAVFRDGYLEAPGMRTRLHLSPELGLVICDVA